MICKTPFNEIEKKLVQRLSVLEVCRPARTKSAASQVCHHDGSTFQNPSNGSSCGALQYVTLNIELVLLGWIVLPQLSLQ